MNKEIKSISQVPKKKAEIKWSICENGNIILEIENKGLMKRLTQKLLKKPKTSYIHLDEIGSFVWCTIDGKRTIEKIGEKAERKFGEKIKPLHERLLKYFVILKSYGFIVII